jgi:opacity protein-like surface antigen
MGFLKFSSSVTIVLTTLCLSLPVANAQSDKWQGAYGQVGIGYQSSSMSYSPWTYYRSNGSSSSGTASADNANNFALLLGVGYNFALSPSFVLGVGGEYAPLVGAKARSTTTYSDTSTSVYGQYNVQYAYNLFLAPGWVIDKEKLLYAKIGYAGAQTKSSPSNNTYSFNGFSLGLGYKQFLTDNIYGFGEVNYTDYGNSNLRTDLNFTGTMTLKATNLLLGLGYKF